VEDVPEVVDEEEEERRRLEESRRRRAEILAKHKQAAAVAAPTAAAQQEAAAAGAPANGGGAGAPPAAAAAAAAEPAAPPSAPASRQASPPAVGSAAAGEPPGDETPEGARSSSSDSENAPGSPVMDVFNTGAPGGGEPGGAPEAESRPPAVPGTEPNLQSERLRGQHIEAGGAAGGAGGGGGAADAGKAKGGKPDEPEDDMFADDWDAAGAAGGDAGGGAGAGKGLHDAYDDAEGYYNFQARTRGGRGQGPLLAGRLLNAARPAGCCTGCCRCRSRAGPTLHACPPPCACRPCLHLPPPAPPPPQVGELMDGRYELFACKGKGVFSTVLRARDMLRADANNPEAKVCARRAAPRCRATPGPAADCASREPRR
jgi:hypothetical protein